MKSVPIIPKRFARKPSKMQGPKPLAHPARQRRTIDPEDDLFSFDDMVSFARYIASMDPFELKSQTLYHHLAEWHYMHHNPAN